MKDSFEKYYDSVTEKKNKRVFEKSITKIKAFFKGEEFLLFYDVYQTAMSGRIGSVFIFWLLTALFSHSRYAGQIIISIAFLMIFNSIRVYLKTTLQEKLKNRYSKNEEKDKEIEEWIRYRILQIFFIFLVLNLFIIQYV